jgi:hypothetical protein
MKFSSIFIATFYEAPKLSDKFKAALKGIAGASHEGSM